MNNFDTLSQAVNTLTENGFTEDFKAEEKYIKALYSKKEYLPTELKLLNLFGLKVWEVQKTKQNFFAIIANDGIKGTLVMSFSAVHFKIEHSFFDDLENIGLIKIETFEQNKYIHQDKIE